MVFRLSLRQGLRIARACSSGMVCGQQVAVPPISRTFSSAACTGDVYSASFRSRPTAGDLPLRFSFELRRVILPPTTARRRHSCVSALADEVEGAPAKEARKPETVNWSKDLANSVSLIGYIGRDVEVKYLDDNRVCAKTSMAVNRGGTKADTPSWFELEFWDSLAEIAQENLKKGARVHVQGRVSVEGWVDAQEAKRTTTKVVVGVFNFVQSDGSSAKPTSLPTSTAAQEQRHPDYPPPSPPPLSKEKLWQEYFSDRSQWWDNRGNKLNPKAPDFKHKTKSDRALWIESYNTPAWVKGQLSKEDSGKGAGQETSDRVLHENVKPGKSKASAESGGWGDF